MSRADADNGKFCPGQFREGLRVDARGRRQLAEAARLGSVLHPTAEGAIDRTAKGPVGRAGRRVFERFALSLVRLGERTGTLDEQSLRLSEHYAQKLKQQIETGTRLFEPVLLLVLAAVLLLVGSTMLGPVYDLAARASSGLQP